MTAKPKYRKLRKGGITHTPRTDAAEYQLLSKVRRAKVVNANAMRDIELESAGAHRRVAELENAIAWALGENGGFAQRKEGQGPYWWRAELRKRSQ